MLLKKEFGISGEIHGSQKLFQQATTADLKAKMKVLQTLWTLPNSLLGIGVGFLGILTGGDVQVRFGCIEFHGGAVTWALKRMPVGAGALAMTLGHTILGQNQRALEIAREHEHVHVRQFERWGPLFIPAYLTASAWLWINRRDCYRENPFEIEAYQQVTFKPLSHRAD